MMTQKFYPSSYYPEYFKADIELGGENELPFATGLDQTLHRFLFSQFLNLSMLSEKGVQIEFMKNFLKNTGFHFEHFSDKQIKDLYLRRADLFSLRGTLAGLDLLAEIHFGKIQSHHGLPFKNQQIHEVPLSGARLSEKSIRCRWITYKIENETEMGLVDTFLKNSELFLPKSIKIYIQMNKTSSQDKLNESSVRKLCSIESSFRLYPRSIPCLTSQK